MGECTTSDLVGASWSCDQVWIRFRPCGPCSSPDLSTMPRHRVPSLEQFSKRLWGGGV